MTEGIYIPLTIEEQEDYLQWWNEQQEEELDDELWKTTETV